MALQAYYQRFNPWILGRCVAACYAFTIRGCLLNVRRTPRSWELSGQVEPGLQAVHAAPYMLRINCLFDADMMRKPVSVAFQPADFRHSLHCLSSYPNHQICQLSFAFAQGVLSWISQCAKLVGLVACPCALSSRVLISFGGCTEPRLGAECTQGIPVQ